LVDTVLTQVDRAIEQDRFDEALDLLAVLRPFYTERMPTEMLLQYGQIHESIAQQRMDRAATMDPLTWQGPGDPPMEARRKAFQEASTHFAESARNYIEHARRVNIADADQHGRSLWQAAVNYDKAQRWTEAIEVYDEFIHTRPVDGQQLQARHRLAGAYLAQGDAKVAIDLFNNLIHEHPTSQWAYESLVPMARAYTAVDDTGEAIQTLREVVHGHPAITPDSQAYHDALMDLARTYYVAGNEDPTMYARAIETLTEAIKRYGDRAEGAELRYMLADALRRSAYALNQKLGDQLADRDRVTVLAERNQRLVDAQELFKQSREAFEARHELSLSPLEKLYRQNAWFYEADCAYYRADYEQAIGRYQEAAERWADTPAALAAMVQIVNAYCELNQFESARTWNNRALRMLDRIEDSAFKQPDMPMTAQHWRDWLRWSAELDLFTKQANAG
jgi:TolA-binding protein